MAQQGGGIYVSGGKPPLKIYIIGLGLVALVVLAWTFRVELGIILLVVAGIGGAYGACRVVLMTAHGWQSLRRARLENDLLAAEVVTRRNHSGVIHHGNYFLQLSDGGWQGVRVRDIDGPQVVDGQAVEVERRRSVLELLSVAEHFSIIGGTGSGKTTLANHLIDAIGGVVYVCDPDAKFNAWSSRAEIIGDGEDYDAIGRTIAGVESEMSRRYQAGPGDYPPIALVVDEAPAVFDSTPNALRLIGRIARRGRKVGIRLVLLSQTDFVRDLGVEWGSARQNLFRISLEPELTRQNQGTVRHWDGRKELIELCGPYHAAGGRWFSASRPALSLPQPVEGEPDPDTAEFVRLVTEDGLSRREACQQVYGVQYGGAIVGKLKSALDAATTATDR